MENITRFLSISGLCALLLCGCAEIAPILEEEIQRYQEERDKKEEEKNPEVVAPTPAVPAPVPTPVETPAPEPDPLPIPEKPAQEEEIPVATKPGKKVVGHDYECYVGCVGGDRKALKFTGNHSGAICMQSKHSCELKCQVPPTYSNHLPESIKVCSGKGCFPLKEATWANWVAVKPSKCVPNGKACAVWARSRSCAGDVAKAIGAASNFSGASLHVKGKEFEGEDVLPLKAWGKDKRIW